ncbi:hypothetical protein KV205_05610 [Streptomyces sp. SKN60]|uniref:hypothetical protein n=1 Tax=Streptomyces sp. SKN60 TaxID=2855506 RepID=UPI0022456C4D|nr:hypothetical protein [Streptomyces sp. SKN60]MCX2180010.1 hypothetical protein [Streptomyces sp. SKN60]
MHALRVISGRPDPGRLAGGSGLYDAQRFPERELNEQLARVGKRLRAAHTRGVEHAAAAAEVFRSIPDHVPAGGRLPTGLTKEAQEEFLLGFRTGLDQYETEHGAVMK